MESKQTDWRLSALPVSGVWLRTLGGQMQVLVEIDGVWRLVIDEYAPLREQSISHIVEPSGMLAAPVDPLGD